MGFLSDLLGSAILIVAAPLVGVSEIMKGEDLSKVSDALDASITCLGKSVEDLSNGDIL